MSEQLVEVKDLKVTYYQNGVETPVVRNVSFEIKKNELPMEKYCLKEKIFLK